MNLKSVGLLLSGAMMMASSALYAESLTVLSDNPNAKIYLNGTLIGEKSVTNYSITPGEYQVKVTDASGTIYSKMVIIEKDKNKTVVTDRFIPVETDYADRSSKLAEGDRIKKSKGNFGVGLEVGVIPGFNVHYSIDPHWGIDMTGYLSNSNGSNNSGIEGRVDYTLVNTVVNGAPASLYLSAGMGRSDSNSDNLTQSSLCLGVDFSTRSASHSQGGVSITNGFDIASALMSLDNMYLKTEIGLGQIDSTTGGHYTGVVGRMGLSLFF